MLSVQLQRHGALQRQGRAVSESLPKRLDYWIARAGFNLLIPPLILLIPWLQELVDQLIFGGNWNLPMTPGGSFLGVLTAPFSHGYPWVMTQAGWQSRTLRDRVRAPLLPVADRLDWEATPLISSP